MSPESRLTELGLTLPPAPKPKGLYRPVLVVGNLAFTSGHLPMSPDGALITGRLGADLAVDAGRAAAFRTGLGILVSLREALGSLDRVRRVVKLLGLVQCTLEFTAQPAVIDGCSELLRDVFGPQDGVGARSAFGVPSLPLAAAVEIEAVFEIEA